MHRFLIFIVLGFGASAFGVAGSGCGGHTRISAGAAVGYPSLVSIEPGLWVVAESDVPIFYTDGLYWMYRDGYWYRSTYYWGGWRYEQSPRVPLLVRRISRPRTYLHYRANRGQRIRRAPVPSVQRRERAKRRPQRRNEVVPSRRGG